MNYDETGSGKAESNAGNEDTNFHFTGRLLDCLS